MPIVTQQCDLFPTIRSQNQFPKVIGHFKSLWGAIAKQQQTHPKVSEKKWGTGQSCIRKGSTTCKIGTLNLLLHRFIFRQKTT